MAACAAFRKESRMKFANATNLDRKSGVAKGRDLQFHFPAQRMRQGRTVSSFRFSTSRNCRSLRFGRDDKVEGGAAPWRGWRWTDRVNNRRLNLAVAAGLTGCRILDDGSPLFW
jgi:hypothetical protein